MKQTKIKILVENEVGGINGKDIWAFPTAKHNLVTESMAKFYNNFLKSCLTKFDAEFSGGASITLKKFEGFIPSAIGIHFVEFSSDFNISLDVNPKSLYANITMNKPLQGDSYPAPTELIFNVLYANDTPLPNDFLVGNFNGSTFQSVALAKDGGMLKIDSDKFAQKTGDETQSFKAKEAKAPSEVITKSQFDVLSNLVLLNQVKNARISIDGMI